MLLVSIPHGSKLQRCQYVQIFALTDVYYYNSTPMYKGEVRIQSRGHICHLTLLYISIDPKWMSVSTGTRIMCIL